MINRRTLLKSAGLAVTAASMRFPARAFAAPSSVITAKAGVAAITQGQTADTNIWGYDGQVPGPVLKVRQNDTLRVRLNNELPQPTSVHWHGIRIDNAMDGSPLVQTPVEPGESFDYSFSSPDAGTFWYHTHTRGFEQLTRGLYGALIIEESTPLKEKFDDDIVLIVDDWMLDKEGQIDEDSIGSMHSMSHGGRTGNWASVNGVNKPNIKVTPGARVRMRLINTCNARILDIVLPEMDAWTVALDGQPVSPVKLDKPLMLAPGQRADLAVDIPVDMPERRIFGIQLPKSVYDGAYLVAGGSPALKPRENPPSPLPDNPMAETRLDLDNAHKVALGMQGGAMGQMREAKIGGKTEDIRTLVRRGKVWAFNGAVDGDTAEPMFEVPRGTTVTIDINNDTAWPHAMHLHGHHFRQIDSASGKELGPWRDTHLMERGEQHTIALVADNPGDWLIHCHMVEHAASGMTGWFKVT